MMKVIGSRTTDTVQVLNEDGTPISNVVSAVITMLPNSFIRLELVIEAPDIMFEIDNLDISCHGRLDRQAFHTQVSHLSQEDLSFMSQVLGNL